MTEVDGRHEVRWMVRMHEVVVRVDEVVDNESGVPALSNDADN